MKLRRLLPPAVLTVAAWAAPLAAAHADSLLYDGISVIEGQQSFVDSFTVTGSGNLTFTLSNIPWLDTVSNLSGFLSSSTGTIGNTMGAGSETVAVGPGTYYAHWFGDAQGTYNLGVVGMNLTFQQGTTPVGLPTSLVLMLSGIGVLFGWQGRRAPAQQDASAAVA